MKKAILALMLLISGLLSSAYATTYNVNSGMSASTINSTATTAAGSTGNTVLFAAGTYSLSSQLSLPCTNGVVYEGPVVGKPTIAYTGTATLSPNGGFSSIIVVGNLPTALIEVSGGGYAVNVPSNGTGYATAGSGCTFQDLNFPTTEGGIYINYPSSGVLIQNNAFQNNNPAPNNTTGGVGNSGVYFDGANLSANGVASNGTSNDSILWNSALNNCYLISQAMYSGAPSSGGDNGGYCNFVGIHGYNNNVEVGNNVLAGTEEGVKVFLQTAKWTSQYNFNMHDNNFSANERILLEMQQSSNGNVVVSHNSWYEPWYPWALTFEISVPLFQCSPATFSTCGAPNSPASTMNDNIIVDNETIIETGSGAHLGPGIEQWGVGAISQYNVLQGGNGTGGTCGGHANGNCLGFDYSIGETFTNANDQYNYFSGTDTWNGTVNGSTKAFSYEDNASVNNAGMNLANTTVVHVSTTLTTSAPTITTGSTNVTIAPPDTNRHYTIFYTTDGSTPAIFGPGGSSGTTQVYTAPFTPSNGAVIKAIAHWGQGANQGIVFPYFGWVPSAVVSATYTGTGGAVTLSSIAVTGSSSLIAGQATVQLTATGTYSNATTANISAQSTWISSNTAVCTVASSTGVVTAVAAGSCTITAQDGTPISPGFAISVSAPTETSAVQSTIPVNGVNTMVVGDAPIQFQTIGTFNNGTSVPVTATSYASSNTSVCTVTSPGGLVSAVAAGTCNITSVSGSSITSSYWTITVSSATLLSISVAGNSAALAIGQSQGMTATGTYNAGPTQTVNGVAWTSSAPTVCSVSPTGQVIALTVGTCNIVATLGSITSSGFTITVSNPAPGLVSVASYPAQAAITTTLALTAVGTYSDNSVAVIPTLTWASSNPSVATVDGNGVVTAVATGETFITAISATLIGTSTIVVPPNVFFTSATPTKMFPFSTGNFGCYVFQSLASGTYSLVVNSDGSFTVH